MATVNVMHYLILKLGERLDSGEYTAARFLHFSRAFNIVDHELLLDKIPLMGIRGVTLNWFRSYLVGRREKIEISYVDERGVNRIIYSILRIVRHGVPRRSVLGPIVFLIYVNYLNVMFSWIITIYEF